MGLFACFAPAREPPSAAAETRTAQAAPAKPAAVEQQQQQQQTPAAQTISKNTMPAVPQQQVGFMPNVMPPMSFEEQQRQQLALLQAQAQQSLNQGVFPNAAGFTPQQQQQFLMQQQQLQQMQLQMQMQAQLQAQQQQQQQQQQFGQQHGAPMMAGQGRHPGDASSDPLFGNTRYQKLRDIGNGTYGFVIAARDSQTGEEVAIKFLERGKTLGKMVEREILSHRLCSAHPHIVQFKELFLTPRYLAIVMEFASGGDLFEYTLRSDGHLTEDEGRALFQQLVSAVAFCHRAGVVNRDIKLENALLSPPLDGSLAPILKLCDFGYSKNEHVDSACKTAAGTPEYVAPEMVLTQGHYDGKAADVWSCGIFLYVLLNGAYPFHTEPGDKLAIKRMVKGIFKFHVPVSPACEDLMRRMLVANPAERISIEDVMRHPWYCHALPRQLAAVNRRVVASGGAAAGSSKAGGAAGIDPSMAPPPSIRQGEEEIRAIVAEAQEVDAMALGAAARFRRP